MNAAQTLIASFYSPGVKTRPRQQFRAGTPKKLKRKFGDRMELRIIHGEVRYGDRVRLR